MKIDLDWQISNADAEVGEMITDWSESGRRISKRGQRRTGRMRRRKSQRLRKTMTFQLKISLFLSTSSSSYLGPIAPKIGKIKKKESSRNCRFGPILADEKIRDDE